MLKVHFLNVGHGDCTVIEHPSGRVSVVDINNGSDIDIESAKSIDKSFGGISDMGSDRGEFGKRRIELLKEKGYDIKLTNPIEYIESIVKDGPIFRYIQTHPDLDHMRGLSELVDRFDIMNFWDTENKKEISEFRDEKDKRDWEAYQKLRSDHKKRTILTLKQGEQRPYFNGYEYGGDDIEILAPTSKLSDQANRSDNHNDHSYVIRIGCNGVNVLLPGDAEGAVWDDLVAQYGSDLSSTVLKASHHGRDSGYHSEAVKKISPQYTIVSVGKKPDTDASNKYRNFSDNVWSTRWKGNITVTVDAEGYGNIESEYDR